jgi:hypothetical protein
MTNFHYVDLIEGKNTTCYDGKTFYVGKLGDN